MDWAEEMEDYANRLKYKNVMEMLEDMSEFVCFDRMDKEITIRAISNKDLSHCFELIDRTVLVFFNFLKKR